STRTITPARRSEGTGTARALVVLAAWTLFAFAGAYLWTIVPLVLASLVLVVVVRPALGANQERIFDAALAACLLVLALQLIPLPAPVRAVLSPSVPRVHDALWLDSSTRTAAGSLSVDPGATAVAFTLAAALALVFWTARGVFADGGIRTVGRGVAWTG